MEKNPYTWHLLHSSLLLLLALLWIVAGLACQEPTSTPDYGATVEAAVHATQTAIAPTPTPTPLPPTSTPAPPPTPTKTPTPAQRFAQRMYSTENAFVWIHVKPAISGDAIGGVQVSVRSGDDHPAFDVVVLLEDHQGNIMETVNAYQIMGQSRSRAPFHLISTTTISNLANVRFASVHFIGLKSPDCFKHRSSTRSELVFACGYIHRK